MLGRTAEQGEGQRWRWICCRSLLPRGKRGRLVEEYWTLLQRLWATRQPHCADYEPEHLGMFQVIWENNAFLGAAQLGFFSKCLRVGNYVPELQFFLLVQCFPWYFPQLLADLVSSFYIWKLRHRSSSLYLDVWLPLSRASCLQSSLRSQPSAPSLSYNPQRTPGPFSSLCCPKTN